MILTHLQKWRNGGHFEFFNDNWYWGLVFPKLFLMWFKNEEMASVLNFWPLKVSYFLYNKWYWDLVFNQMFSIHYVKYWWKKGGNRLKSCGGECQDDVMISCLKLILYFVDPYEEKLTQYLSLKQWYHSYLKLIFYLTDPYEGASSGNFMAYFLTGVVLCVAGYVLFHNKQKVKPSYIYDQYYTLEPQSSGLFNSSGCMFGTNWYIQIEKWLTYPDVQLSRQY